MDYTGGYTVTENGSAFDRGVAAGEIAQRLKEHDQHLGKINGSMADVANRLDRMDHSLGDLLMQFQRMADAMVADRATVVTTAEAVEKERTSTAAAVEKQRTTARDATERRWSPLTRLGVATGVLAALVTIALTIWALIPKGH